MTSVLVLGGGPDAERDVSVKSATAVAHALEQRLELNVELRVIESITLDEIRSAPVDVVWPALHGPWGEGGPLQDLLESSGKAYVGAGPTAARLAMDKIATKTIAQMIGAQASISAVVNPRDEAPPLPLPVVVKPVHEGSTIGLHVCHEIADWRRALEDTLKRSVPSMVEPFIAGRELTVGLIEEAEPGEMVRSASGVRGPCWRALPLIEIIPADGLYDYEAKYVRSDTRYVVEPNLPQGAAERLAEQSIALAAALGCRSLARVDFILDEAAEAWLLELNTMPGFTDHSLVPMAALAAGLDMPALCATIVEGALAQRGAGRAESLA